MSVANGAAPPNLQIFIFRFLEYCAEGLYNIVSFALNILALRGDFISYIGQNHLLHNWFPFKHFEWLITKLAHIWEIRFGK